MPKLILVAEDDLTMQKILKVRLTQVGFDVVCADNGLEGLNRIKEQIPDLIISDVVMPVMSGYLFYKELKKNAATANIPVLIITNYPETQDSFLLTGVVDSFITKPFDLEQLISKVKQLISGLRIKSIHIPMDEQGVVKISRKKDEHMVLFGADLNDLTKALTKDLKDRGYQFAVADSGQELIEKTAQYHPRLVLTNVNLRSTPAVEIIHTLNEFKGLESQILVYSYFTHEDMAEDSDLHYFYTTNIEHIAKESRLPVAYLGAFSKKVSKDNLIKAIDKYL